MDIKRKAVFQSALVLFAAVIFGLFMLEFFSGSYLRKSLLLEKLSAVERKISSKNNPPIGFFDKDLGWGLKPNSSGRRVTTDFDVEYSINSRGFRDSQVRAEKSPLVLRIIALGESTVFGEGVNYGKRFTEIIETSIDNVEVVNMGVWGYGADQSLLQLERDGWQMHPDIVIMFTINDFFQRCKYFSRIGGLKPRFVLNPEKNAISLQDMTFVTDNFKAPASSLLSQQRSASGTGKNKKFLSGSKFIALLNYNNRLKELNKKSEALERERLSKIKKDLVQDWRQAGVCPAEDFQKIVYFILKKYAAICREHSAEFIVVHIDTAGQPYLENTCRELNIAYLDLAQVLFVASKARPLRFSIDPHYNDFTHKVIGQYVSEYIAKKYGSLRSALIIPD
jgi:hypothetical protein